MAENTMDSEYEIQLEILKELGGEDKNYDSPYSIQLEILDKVKQGGGGAIIDDENISPNTVWSSEKVYDELGGIIIQDGQQMTQELYDFIHHRPFPHNEHKLWLKKNDVCYKVVAHFENSTNGLWIYAAQDRSSFLACWIGSYSVGQTIRFTGGHKLINDGEIGNASTYSSQKIENMIGDIDTILQTIIGA